MWPEWLCSFFSFESVYDGPGHLVGDGEEIRERFCVFVGGEEIDEIGDFRAPCGGQGGRFSSSKRAAGNV